MLPRQVERMLAVVKAARKGQWTWGSCWPSQRPGTCFQHRSVPSCADTLHADHTGGDGDELPGSHSGRRPSIVKLLKGGVPATKLELDMSSMKGVQPSLELRKLHQRTISPHSPTWAHMQDKSSTLTLRTRTDMALRANAEAGHIQRMQ